LLCLLGGASATEAQTTAIVAVVAPEDLVSAGRINGDSLLDLVIARRGSAEVRVLTAVDRAEFRAELSLEIPVAEVSGIAVLALAGAATDTIVVADAASQFVLLFQYDEHTQLPVLINMIDTSGYLVTVFAVESEGTVLVMGTDGGVMLKAVDPLLATRAQPISPARPPGRDPVARCGNEPPLVLDDGTVQGCIDRAKSVTQRCIWASCFLWHNGEINNASHMAGVAACAVVHAAQVLGCMRRIIFAATGNAVDLQAVGEVVVASE